jgi:DNA replication protein DnaC
MQAATDQRLVRVYDRILETCYPVQFAGVSWRQNEASKRYERMKALEEGA